MKIRKSDIKERLTEELAKKREALLVESRSEIFEALDSNKRYHTAVKHGVFQNANGFGPNKKYLHDKDQKDAKTRGYGLVTVGDKHTAEKIAKEYGGKTEKTMIGTYRIFKEETELEEERFKVKAITKDGETFSSKTFSSKKDADSYHWKLAKDNKYKSVEVVKEERFKVNYIHPDKKNIGNDKFDTKAQATKYANALKKKGYHDVNVSRVSEAKQEEPLAWVVYYQDRRMKSGSSGIALVVSDTKESAIIKLKGVKELKNAPNGMEVKLMAGPYPYSRAKQEVKSAHSSKYHGEVK